MNQSTLEAAPAAPTRTAAQTSILAMIGAVLCWGTGPVMSKSALNFSGPLFLLVIQLAASLVFLFIALIVTKKLGRLNRAVLKPALTGILEPGLGYGLGNIGLVTTTVSAATLLGPSEAIFTCVLGFVFFKKRPNLITLISIVSIAVGVALIVAPSLSGRREVGSFVGNMFVLSGDVAAALYITLSSKLLETQDPLVLAFSQQVAGLVMVMAWLGMSMLAGTETPLLLHLTLSQIAYAALSGVIEFGPPMWLFLIALRALPANVVAIMMSLVPVVAIVEARIFLGEAMAPVQVIGGAMIVLTMLVIRRGE